MIPPALNTDLGGKGLHNEFPPVAEFIDAVFQQLNEGKTEITFGLSEIISKGTPDMIKTTFARMNH